MSKLTVEWVLWGYLPGKIKVCRLKVGSLKSCASEERYRTSVGWACATYRQGVTPDGLLAIERKATA